MKEYRITFGQKYRRELHPTFPGANPDGWVTIIADSWEQARDIANITFGQAFAFCYEEPFKDEDWRFYPQGEIERIEQ